MVNYIFAVVLIMLGVILYIIYQRQRCYYTERTIQIVSYAKRICLTRSDIRELLFYTDARSRCFYLVKTTDQIYNLGRLQNFSQRRKFLNQMEASTGLSWEHTKKYFRYPSQY